MSFFKSPNPNTLIAEEELYLAADGTTIVHAGDWRAATLLAAAGSDIPQKIVARLNLAEGAKVETLQKEGPKPEQRAAAKEQYDKQVAAAAVAYRKKDLPAAIAAYEAAAKVPHLESTHQASATQNVKALKAQLEGEKGQHVLGKSGTVSPEDVATRSTRPEKPTDVR